MIVETIVSTRGPDGKPNFAPMGARIPEEGKISLLVYHPTRTYKNLKAAHSCVINMVSDARLFVLTTLYDHQPPHRMSAVAAGAIMDDAEKALEFAVDGETEMEGKTEFTGHIIGSHETGTPPAGFCRAEGAVIEALIAVTRRGLLPAWEVADQLRRSRIIVEKTGGPIEIEAMRLIGEHWGKNV